MNKDLDWVHHDTKTFDEEKFMENIERKYIKKHTSHIEGFTKDYIDKLLEEKDKEIERLNNIIDELEKDMRETMEILKTTEYQKIDIDYVIETLDIYCNRLKELKESK